MQIYEVSNPSDPITMAAEIDAVAACAGLLLGRGKYGVNRKADGETVLPIFLLGGFEGWAESVQFDAGDIAARWRDIVTCLRTVAVGSPPEDVRGDRDKLAAWNDKHRSSMNDISAAAQQIADWLEKTHGPSGPAPFTEVHLRTDKIDRAIADLRDSNLARMALPALYLSTGRYMPDEAKRAREVLSGFCDAAGKPTPKADATHVGWSLVA